MPVRFANAPVSWGVDIVQWGDRPPYEKFLDELTAAGYEGTELGPYGYLPTDADLLRRQLASRSLTLTAAFVDLPLKEADTGLSEVDKVASLLKKGGAEWIVLSDTLWPEREAVTGRVKESGVELDGEGWTNLTRNVRAACEMARRYNLRPVFHHHAGTYIETPEELARVVESTDVAVCLDTGHYIYGGGDPVEAARAYGDRIEYLHWKDVDRVRLDLARRNKLSFTEGVSAGVFCSLGEGCVRFRDLWRQLKTSGYDGWIVVEQDVDTSDRSAPAPFESAKVSRQYLREIMDSSQGS